MPRKLIIFGNGLGMATDPNHFLLANAIRDVWQMPNVLSDYQKDLICRCTGRQGRHPAGEEELGTLHQAVAACKTLNEISHNDIRWLSHEGQQFPSAISNFIHKVATRLHNYDGNVNMAFFGSLAEFVSTTRSHVATLNYDKLIYSYFIDHRVLDGYDGALVDGIVAAGFSETNLIRRYGRDFGYYLHLHGSPLFMQDHDVIYKIPRHRLSLDMEEFSTHLVLTHVKFKTSVINSSPILASYWDYFSRALNEVQEVILFGYSGCDRHLNAILNNRSAGKRIRVVEWAGNGIEHVRQNYWRTRLGMAAEIQSLDNITDFRDW